LSFRVFFIKGGDRCTCPVKFGLIWIHEEEPKIESYTSFDNFTPEQYASIFPPLEEVSQSQEEKTEQSEKTEEPEKTKEPEKPEQQKEDESSISTEPSPDKEKIVDPSTSFSLPSNLPKPDLSFLTDAKNIEFYGEFPLLKKGKFVHLKFVSSHLRGEGEGNVDIQKIGLIGYLGDTSSVPKFPKGAIPTLVKNYFPYGLSFTKPESKLFDFQSDISTIFKIGADQLNVVESAPEIFENLQLEKTDIDDIIEKVSSIDPDKNANVFERLTNILPIIHTFRLFSGYRPEDLLLKPM